MRIILSLLFFLLSLCLFSQNRQGKDRALFFAVNTYDKMTDLKNPVQNARDIAAELEQNYGFNTEVVPNPTLEQIEEKIQAYKSNYATGRYAKDGQLLIFFTGHGTRKGDNGYFMPKDALPSRPHVSAIEYDYWRDEINKIDCKHILVAIDACHSITFDPNWKNKPNRNFSRPGEQFADKVLLNHQAHRARLFFTSDAEGSETPDRSTFARQLLEGLRTYYSNTNYITSSELFGSYLKKANPTPGGGDFGDDEPGSTFLFFQKPKVDVSNARSDLNAWQEAKAANSIAAYQQYLRQYPKGDFHELAQQRLTRLEAEEKELLDWKKASKQNTATAYRAFIQNHPNSDYRDLAELRLGDLKPDQKTPPAKIDDMVFVQGGTFQMGTGSDKHSVKLDDFYMGINEVTFEDYDKYCVATGRDKPDDKGWGRGKRPVINIDWYDALEYCNWLSHQKGLSPVYQIDKKKKDASNSNTFDDKKWTVRVNWNANGYRLPTEAEWEYAARSRGGNEKWSGTSTENNLSTYANYWENGDNDKDGYENTAPVKSYRANSLGLYDMSGNVWEWCWDWYDDYSKNASINPKGSNTGANRVIRGGSWNSRPAYLRCAYRNRYTPDNRNDDFVGFRLSRAGF